MSFFSWLFGDKKKDEKEVCGKQIAINSQTEDAYSGDNEKEDEKVVTAIKTWTEDGENLKNSILPVHGLVQHSFLSRQQQRGADVAGHVEHGTEHIDNRVHAQENRDRRHRQFHGGKNRAHDD